MLFLLFQLGNDRYALDASRVVEVLPLVELQSLPGAPRGVAGVFNYRGRPVPALDLCELTLRRAAREHLSTRIVVVRCPGAGGQSHLLGLIAEQATEVLRRDRRDFTGSGVQVTNAPYLGPMAADARGMIQWIYEDRLLPETVRESLFAQALPPAHESH
jgi:chemotaxis-related protein WspB